MTRSTHTIVTLEVSQAAYDEIAGLLRASGYDHVFDSEVLETGPFADMTGIAITPPIQAAAVAPPTERAQECANAEHQLRQRLGAVTRQRHTVVTFSLRFAGALIGQLDSLRAAAAPVAQPSAEPVKLKGYSCNYCGRRDIVRDDPAGAGEPTEPSSD